jgi:hypothetical protein
MGARLLADGSATVTSNPLGLLPLRNCATPPAPLKPFNQLAGIPTGGLLTMCFPGVQVGSSASSAASCKSFGERGLDGGDGRNRTDE